MISSEPSIWRSGAFVRLWAATTVSYFGSFITRTALPLAAILMLGAGPLEISALRGLELVAGLLVGLVVGAWVDRLRRRPIMVGADLGRAALLATIPVAAVAGVLALPQLLIVAFLAAILTTCFDVASRTYLPTIVPKAQLVTANSALTASASAAEFTGFGVSGFLIQLFTAPIAIAVDAASFVVSALALGSIRQPEPPVPAVVDREPVLREIRDGLRVVLGSPTLRAIAAAHGSTHLLWGIFGTVYLLFATRDLALGPAAIGIIAGVGGAGSFLGAAVAGRVIARLGIGQTMLLGMAGFTVGNALIPLAPSGAVLVGAAFLVAQQLIGDSAGTLYDVVETSLTQSIVAPRILGRVTASISTYTTLLSLVGTIVGGILAELLGLRAAMAIGILGGVAAFAFIWFSPIRTMRVIPAGFAIAPTPEDAPLIE
ncbi:MAG TPA: MFS transporter [Candidatus Limnocylindria bacterium]